MIEATNLRSNDNMDALQPFDTLMMNAMAMFGMAQDDLAVECSYDSTVWMSINRYVGNGLTFASVALRNVDLGFSRGKWFKSFYENERVETEETYDAFYETYRKVFSDFCLDLSRLRRTLRQENADHLLCDMVALGSMFMNGDYMERFLFCDEEEGADGTV